jgi:hypothetical protein
MCSNFFDVTHLNLCSSAGVGIRVSTLSGLSMAGFYYKPSVTKQQDRDCHASRP